MKMIASKIDCIQIVPWFLCTIYFFNQPTIFGFQICAPLVLGEKLAVDANNEELIINY